MKACKFIWTIALLAAVITGCRDVDERLDKIISDRVELTDTEVILPSAGRTESVVVTSDLSWHIEGQSEWCTVSPTSGSAGTSTIYFTSIPNPEYDDRSVNYTLVCGEKRTVVTVYQKKKDEIVFDKAKFDNIPMEGGEIEVGMMTNVTYTIDFPEGADKWIEHLPAARAGSRALERKSERFKIGPTDEWDERMGLIVFIREDGRTRDTVKVFQVQRDKIVLTPNVIRPVIEGQTITVELRSNIEYNITVPALYADWLHVEQPNPDVLRVRADEHPEERYGEIHITDSNNPSLTAVLQVYQIEKDMVLFEEQTLEVEQAGGTFVLDVLDNIAGDYELVIPKYATWIKKAPGTRALNPSTVSIEVAENPADKIARTAKLFLKGVGTRNGGEVFMSVPIQVTQKGRTLLADDEAVLVAIQNAMGLVHNNWPPIKEDVTLSYSGVNSTFMKNGKIATELLLPSSNTTYTITTQMPEVVGDLKNLTKLTLPGHLSGNIPVSIGSMASLKTLVIETRKAPSPGYNGIPPELGGIETLETLTITHDFSETGADLTTILDFIGDLSNLKTLTIKNCNYGTKMPESWRNLTKLETLVLEGTGFVDLSPISDMVSLKEINIKNDAIEDLPDLSRLTQLSVVKLVTNADLTKIPASLMSVSSLTNMTISPNYLEILPDDWSQLVNLDRLDISNYNHNHKITGTLPPSMGSMTKLKTLYLRYNEFEGEIPAEFGNFKDLTTFSIEFNKFTSIANGVLPNFRNITVLNLHENAFVEFPADIIQMTWLTSLNAKNNEFSGELPANIGDLELLTEIDLSRDLSRIFVSPGLGGRIPASITKLTKLKKLNLSNNNFIGYIPSDIGDMTALQKLYLNDNNLGGVLPLSLSKLTDPLTTKEIFLQNNNLTGSIPDAYRQIGWFLKFDVRDNNLEGPVPEGLVLGTKAFQGTSSVLHLSGNRLTGALPPKLREKYKETHSVTWQILKQQPGYGLTVE